MVQKKRGRREKRKRRDETYCNKGDRQEKGKMNEQRAKKELNGSVGPN